MKKVFAVILHYRDKALTRQCLTSLQKVQKKNFKLKTVVIDNDKKNLGFAAGNNVGIREAQKQGADYILLLNNDTTVAPDFLIKMLAAAQNNQAGIVAPKIYFAPGYEYHQTEYKPSEQGKVFWYAGGQIDWANVLCSHRGVDEVDHGQYDRQMATDFASGCCLLTKREVLDQVGLLDQRYFLYLEDVEFCQRVKKAGFKIIYQPQAEIWHYNASSSQVGGGLHDYFITRNRLLFGLAYAPWRAKLGLIKESARLLITGRPWQKAGVRDFYLKKFNQGSWHD
ncbi:glycosyltransferase family 2 protein [Candidatus Shapirobacteria bacterium CG10_big_fil_rev_8_21_14_0_10_48_15]|uniref:Glycosyltransferase family 2 protein n=1 Tax=Candidatus Shapirobacteria bacterium CG10_big_fil_rev_8_21_14_0_10_48_15 TaxID=1974484 RepID=A0A2M8L805_9BACT|nr:MAG: glycosyltransferase family 2 protein [Candidatus Shapirobacteria bacterium CG10_big_fil_rev_8_21_14_0_10_48_15]